MVKGWGNIFDVLTHPYEEEETFAINNLYADSFFSRLAKERPEEFKRKFPELSELVEATAGLSGEVIPPQHPLRAVCDEVNQLDLDSLEAEVERRKSVSISQIRLFTSNNCEAVCPSHCYTKQLKGAYDVDSSVLTVEQRRELIIDAKKLGAKLLYIAGRGEPLLDPGLFDMLKFTREQGLEVLLFTNGIMLSNDAHAQRFWQKRADDLVRIFVDLDVHVYHKLWSTDPKKQESMMCTRPRTPTYEWVDYSLGEKTIKIPRGLYTHLQMGNKRRIGVETVVDRNTTEEIRETIIPFIQETGIRSYLEPFITSGRGAKHQELVPEFQATHSSPISEYLVREGCRLTSYIMTVLEEGTMSFCLSVESEIIRKQIQKGRELNVVNKDGSLKDIFALNHTHPFVVKNRYQGFLGGCRCQTFNAELHGMGENKSVS